MTHVSCDIGISADGFAAGTDQSLDDPLGIRGEELHEWMFKTPDENADEIAAILGHGAYIMGRNMFGPIRGEWHGDWKGWWGDDPPYHAPVFVLTHYERPPLTMAGGTTFHFVTDGAESALAKARAAAGEQSISIAGGASTVRQYLQLGVIDELRLHIAPVLLGSGERLFDGLDDLRFEPLSSRSTSLVTHVTYRVLAASDPDVS